MDNGEQTSPVQCENTRRYTIDELLARIEPQYREMTEQIANMFKCAVSAARGSGQAPDLSAQTRQNILDGLELYAQEMRANDREMEDWALECDILAESLKEQWQVETDSAPPRMEGKSL